jgi:murein DD-endopeptidase MepM/ murein hydrolase activator NlpD
LKYKKKIKLLTGLAGVAAVVLFIVIWLAVEYYESEVPSLELSLATGYLGKGQAIRIDVADRKSGIRSVWVAISKGAQEHVLLDREVRGAGGKTAYEASFDIDVDPVELGIDDGPAVMRMVVRDKSWRRWWHGNLNYLEKDVIVDTRPPDVSVLSRRHYINQGGAGLVIYRISEDCEQSGVLVGDRLFAGRSGYFDDTRILMSFFALDTDQGPGTRMVAVAVDRAGNRTEVNFNYTIRRKVFKKDAVTISDRFLNSKVAELIKAEGSNQGGALLDKYVWANRDLRQQNYATVAEMADRSQASILWEGKFLRLPGSVKKTGFGELRQYRYMGRAVDRQVHQGVDLASVARAQVPAANSGKVIYAGSLGIYGKTIVIDHGFGLLSTYSHLSRIDVNVDQMVARGEIIGRTGATGLAGGDHLHFGIFVQHHFTNPLEWWDAAWLANNIVGKIKEVRETWQ